MTEENALPLPAGGLGCVSAVALVGFMGAGKTTVGRTLAERLGWRFADLDERIEAQQGRTIPQIFAEDGERRFREIERDALAREFNGGLRFLVLALGGGAFVSESIREALRSQQVPAVWLDAPAEELFRRCEQPSNLRPLRRDLRQFCELYETRAPSYGRADLKVATGSKAISVVVEEIIARLGLVPADRSSE
jgi:shikimate kinase